MSRIRPGLLLLLCLHATATAVLGQNAATDTSRTWTHSLSGRLSFAQTGFQNWSEGGISSFAMSGGLNAEVDRKGSRWAHQHDARISFGIVKQDSLGVRKAEDLIHITATFTYAGDGFFGQFHPTLATSVRTQFANGFTYEGSAPERVSTFLAPATFTQAAGFAFTLISDLTQRVGLGAKETLVTTASLRDRFGVNPDRAMRIEAGLEAVTRYDGEIFRNVHLKSTLSLFASFNKPEQPDAFWDVFVTMKVNRWLQVNFEYHARYDADITRALQMREVLSVGLSFSIS